MIKLKRTYDPAEDEDGVRFLIDALWPRGVKKERLKVDFWLRLVSPSEQLRHWFKHDPKKWEEFKRRYAAELDKKPQTWKPLLRAAQAGDITLLFSAHDVKHNNAVVLEEYLKQRLTTAGK